MRYLAACLAAAAVLLALGARADGRNLTPNSGFEDGMTGWLGGNGWYENPKGSGVSASVIDDDMAHTGRRSLRMDGRGNRGLTMAVVPAIPGRYRLSAWIRTRAMGSQATVLAEWMGGDGGKWLSGTPLAGVAGDSGWTLVEGEVTAPAGTRFVHVDLLTNAANTGTAWFDDVTLCRAVPSAAAPGPVRFSAAAPSGGSGEIRVDWSGHAGEDDIVSYRVYCADRPMGEPRGLAPRVAAPGDARTATIGGLRIGRRCFVSVAAVNIEGMVGAPGEWQAVVPADRRPPRAPGLRLTPLATGVRLWPAALARWTAGALDGDIAGFTVCGLGGDGREIAVLRRVSAGQRSVVLTRLPRGIAAVVVRAADRAGNVSSSNPASWAAGAPAAAVGGTGVRGRVTAGGVPAAGAAVEVRQGGRVVARTRAAADGRFVVGRAPSGTLTAQAVGAGGIFGSAAHLLGGGGAVQADLEAPAGSPWTAWATTPVENVFRDALPPAGASLRIELLALANQKRSAQVAIRPNADLTLTGVRFEPLVSEAGAAIPAERLSFNFVSFVRLKANSTAMAPGELLRKAPGDFPDELSDDTERRVGAGQTQPIFLTIDVPKGAVAGTYCGRAWVETAVGEQPFDIRLRVLPLEFPAKTRMLCVNWLDWGALARKHGVEPWTDRFFDVMRIYTRLMREHHQNVIVIPPDLCRIVVEPDGSAAYDWSLFDRASEFFIAEGLGERICVGHLGGRTTGEWECPTFSLSGRLATRRDTGEAASVSPEAFAAALQSHLERRGWLARFMQHVGDEPTPVNVASYREQAARVRSAAPKLRRIDAIHVPDLKGALEVWVPELEYFDQWYEGYRRFQRAGVAELWFYIAWVPQGRYPQRLIDTQAIKARTIHWMNYLWETSGYLHWALEWWDMDVEALAPGDSRIIWPGREGPNSSLRYEAQREGFEDCELLFMLEDAGRAAARKLGVTRYNAKARPKELGHSVVRTLTDYTRSYAELEAARGQIAAEIAGLRQGPALLTQVSRTADRPRRAGEVTVNGWTEAGARVTVNGREVSAAGGRFTAKAAISALSPSIVVRASLGGRVNEVTRRYRVERAGE